MFKIPEWEDDIPKNNLTFSKKLPKQKKKNNGIKSPQITKPNNFKPGGKAKNQLKVKSKLKSVNSEDKIKNITNNLGINKKPKIKKQKKRSISNQFNQTSNKSKELEKSLVLNNYDSDKLDELILNEKKKKLNLPKTDNTEEVLFNENNDESLILNGKVTKTERKRNKNKLKFNIEIKHDKQSSNIVSSEVIPVPGKSEQKTIRKNKVEEARVCDTEDKYKDKVVDNDKKLKKKVKDVQNVDTGKGKYSYHVMNSPIKSKPEKNESQSDIDRPKENSNVSEGFTQKNKMIVHNIKNSVVNGKVVKTKKSKKNKMLSALAVVDSESSNLNVNDKSEQNSASGTPVQLKTQRKKEALKALLHTENHRNPINASGNGTSLRERMLERLKAAKFRYLNEKLYTSSGSDAKKLFELDPDAFKVYHEGYQQQLKKWPVKPLDVIVKRIQKMPKESSVADMGCGQAELSRRVAQRVRSFDLVARAEGVEECDMRRTPLPAASVHAAVYCLALMGTDLTHYLLEANRVLKTGGHLLIAEVESRFDDVDAFIRDVQKLGFSLKKLDKSEKVFFFMEFTKVREAPVKKSKLPVLTLKPCIYKKR